MKYKTDKDLWALLRSFESGTVSRDEWGHAEHLIVAYLYVSENELDAAFEKMKRGILNLLTAFGIDTVKEMPYHETLTVFWMRTIHNFANEKKGEPMIEACREMISKFDKDFPLEYYSKDLLFSDDARARFVPPERDQNELPPFLADAGSFRRGARQE